MSTYLAQCCQSNNILYAQVVLPVAEEHSPIHILWHNLLPQRIPRWPICSYTHVQTEANVNTICVLPAYPAKINIPNPAYFLWTSQCECTVMFVAGKCLYIIHVLYMQKIQS